MAHGQSAVGVPLGGFKACKRFTPAWTQSAAVIFCQEKQPRRSVVAMRAAGGTANRRRCARTPSRGVTTSKRREHLMLRAYAILHDGRPFTFWYTDPGT